MDTVQFVQEALKTFEAIKPGIEGMIATGSALSATTKGSVYVLQKGTKFISYLIQSGRKKPVKKSSGGKRKPAPTSKDKFTIAKDDVAIVVDISRRILTNVAGFLDKQKIDADIVMVTNDPSYGEQVIFLNPESEKEWNDVILEFKTLMNKIKRTAGGKRVHLFFSAPLPLVFAMGAVWGTVDDAVVYHWENNTYHKVIDISRKLR